MLIDWIASFWRRLAARIEGLQAGRTGPLRPRAGDTRILAFFSSPGEGDVSRCPTCGQERTNTPHRGRGSKRRLARLLAFVTLAAGGIACAWLGWAIRGAVAQPVAPGKQKKASATARPTPAPTASAKRAGMPDIEQNDFYMVYSSVDRATARPLFGLSIGPRGGPDFFTVLCDGSRSVLALGNLMSPRAGAWSDAKAFTAAGDAGIRAATRRGGRSEFHFDEGPAELFDGIPKDPRGFLDRIGASQRVRSEAGVFETGRVRPALDRIRQTCNFQ